jgi:hypothetical protein
MGLMLRRRVVTLAVSTGHVALLRMLTSADDFAISLRVNNVVAFRGAVCCHSREDAGQIFKEGLQGILKGKGKYDIFKIKGGDDHEIR